MTTTSRLDSLKDILARVDKATGPSEETDALALCAVVCPGGFVMQSRINGAWCIYDGTLDRGSPRLWNLCGDWYRVGGWPLTSSIDACFSLAERVLPGQSVALLAECSGVMIHNNLMRDIEDDPTKLPLAMLSTILTALIEVEGKGEEV